MWEILKAKEKRVAEDEMVRWHHQFNRSEFEQTPGDSEGQGVWPAPIHGVAELDMT